MRESNGKGMQRTEEICKGEWGKEWKSKENTVRRMPEGGK